MTAREVNFWYWLVDKLPNKLVYFCFMKVWANATTGENSHRDASTVKCGQAVTLFSKKHNIEF